MDFIPPQPQALSKPADVRYRRAENAQAQCGMCGNFSPPSACTKVEGKIDPSFTCDLWTPLESAPPGGQSSDDLMKILFGGA